MTEQRGDPGYAVTTQRVGDEGGGRRGRRGRDLLAVLIAVLAVAVVGISVVGERLAEPPSLDLSFLPTPTPRPTPTPAPTAIPTPVPTDLARITRNGDEIRPGRIPYVTDGFHLLDMASGDIVDGPPVAFGRDLVFDDPTGNGWLCLCGTEGQVEPFFASAFGFIRIEPAGQDWQDVGQSVQMPDPAGFQQVSSDIDLAADHGHGLLAIGMGRGDVRTVSVAPFDAGATSFGPLTVLPDVPQQSTGPSSSADPSTAPSGSPPFDPGNVSYDGPHIRIAPDGRTAFIWDGVQIYRGEATSTKSRTWRLDLAADGSVTKIGPAPGLAELPFFCQHVAFLANDRLIWVCPDFGEEPFAGSPETSVRVLDLEGRTIATVNLPAVGEQFSLEPLVDRANGLVYVWDSYGLVMTRLDVATMAFESVTYDASADSSPGFPPRPVVEPSDWAPTVSALVAGAYRRTTATADGSRLALMAYRQDDSREAYGPVNLGVFVIDRATLGLVDRWAPAASYFSMIPLADGRSVAIGGMPGADAAGHQLPWEASLTIHDVADGRIVAQFGRLGSGMPPFGLAP